MKIACAPNFRDMGGKATAGGGQVRERQLFRAEMIGAPGKEDAALLDALGIRLVCDLRSDREREVAPSHWLNTEAEIVECDVTADFRASDDRMAILRANPGEGGATSLMLDTYRALPAACAPHLGMLLRRMAVGDVPVLVHCTAGKDRTGFVSAMILSVLGVHRDDVMADYLETMNRPNPAVIAAARDMIAHHLNGEVSEPAVKAIMGAHREYLAASFETIAAEYGSLEGYLAGPVGLDGATRERLVERLVH